MDTLLYYKEAKDGQILEEGITEAGSLSSFIAAGTAYATHGVNTIPFFIYYSMFGFQRVGDFIWAAADSRGRGFLLGGTAGRTTLAGEGLQHQDGNSHTSRLTRAQRAGPTTRPTRSNWRRSSRTASRGCTATARRCSTTHRHERAVRDAGDAGRLPPRASSRGCTGSGSVPAPRARSRRSSSAAARFSTKSSRRRACSRSMAWPPTSGARRATTSCTARPIAPSAGTCCIRPRKPRVPYVTECLAGTPGVVVAASDYLKSQPDMVSRWVGRPMVTSRHRRLRPQRGPAIAARLLRSRCPPRRGQRRCRRWRARSRSSQGGEAGVQGPGDRPREGRPDAGLSVGKRPAANDDRGAVGVCRPGAAQAIES